MAALITLGRHYFRKNSDRFEWFLPARFQIGGVAAFNKEVNSIAWALWGSTFLRDFFLCGVYESIRKNGGHEAGVLLNRGRLQPKIPSIRRRKINLPRFHLSS